MDGGPLIIANGVPKSGTTLLVSYLVACGVTLEPGGLIADETTDERLVLRGGWPWGKVRGLADVLADRRTDRVIGAHCPADVALDGHTVVLIFRHPRDVLLSTARWRAVGLDWTRAKEPPRAAVDRHVTDLAVASILRQFEAYAPWLDRADGKVRFRDFIERPHETAAALCARLGIEPVDPATVLGDAVPWLTESYRGTWSGKNTDWRAYWNRDYEAMWRTFRGPEIERRYGYFE